MIARTHTCSVPGINAILAAVKVDLASGLPGLSMAMQAKDTGCGDRVLPAGNAREASMLMKVGGLKTKSPPSVPGVLNSFLRFPFALQTIFAKLSNISTAARMIQDCGRKTQFHACT